MARGPERTMRRRSLHPGTEIGHVHLRVADLERAIAFYRDVLGFDVTGRVADQAAFLSAGGYHHHIGLNTFESKGGTPPPSGSTGLHHFAIRFPTREALSEAVRRVRECGVALDGLSDHGATLAVYLRDPDDNGIELGCDRPRDEWPRAADGSFLISREPLDLKALVLDG